MSDPGKSYRTHKEVQTKRQTADPILLLKNRVLEHNLLTENDIAVSLRVLEMINS